MILHCEIFRIQYHMKNIVLTIKDISSKVYCNNSDEIFRSDAKELQCIKKQTIISSFLYTSSSFITIFEI